VLLGVKPLPEILTDEPTVPDEGDNEVIVPAEAALTRIAGIKFASMAMIIVVVINRKVFLSPTVDFPFAREQVIRQSLSRLALKR
jgi:hypothetical protein